MTPASRGGAGKAHAESRRVTILFMKTLTDSEPPGTGLSQADVAKALHISASAVKQYLSENGEYLPAPERRRVTILFMKTLTDRMPSRHRTEAPVVEAGLSQADVAKALHISASAVNQWERGLIKNMKLDHFFALAVCSSSRSPTGREKTRDGWQRARGIPERERQRRCRRHRTILPSPAKKKRCCTIFAKYPTHYEK